MFDLNAFCVRAKAPSHNFSTVLTKIKMQQNRDHLASQYFPSCLAVRQKTKN